MWKGAMQRFTTNLRWTCPECGNDNDQEIEVPELDFSGEKSSDMAVDDMAELVCGECETVYTGWVYVNPSETNFEMEEPHSFSVSGDIPMYEPVDDDYEPPTDPFSIIIEALGSLKKMLGAPTPESDGQFTNRLIFSGAISLFEAYIGDTLINAVNNEKEVRDKLVSANPKFKDLKIPAAQLVVDAEILTKLIIKELRSILYHKLEVVMRLYGDAFSINIFPSKELKDAMFAAVPKRHDCVHRNGNDTNGNKLTDFTDGYVLETINTIESVVYHVEKERTKGSFSEFTFN